MCVYAYMHCNVSIFPLHLSKFFFLEKTKALSVPHGAMCGSCVPMCACTMVGAMPIKIGVYACYINSYLHDLFEPIPID